MNKKYTWDFWEKIHDEQGFDILVSMDFSIDFYFKKYWLGLLLITIFSTS